MCLLLVFIHTHTRQSSALSFSTQVFPEAESVWLTLDAALCENERFSVTAVITILLHSTHNSACLFFSALHFLALKGLMLLFSNLVICHNWCFCNSWILSSEKHNWLVRPVQIFTFSATKMNVFYGRNLCVCVCVIKIYL